MATSGKEKKVVIPTERTSMVSVRFTPEERKLVKAHADAVGLSLATHIRTAMLSEARQFFGKK